MAISNAQKIVTTEEQVWIGFQNQTRITHKWGIHLDAHLRLKNDFVGDLSQAILRIGSTYYVKEDVRLSLGYAYAHNFPAPGHANIGLPEHRLWQQIQWFERGQKVKLMQWIRLEERYNRKTLNDQELGDGYYFNWRIRYQIALAISITKKRFEPGGFQFLASNELFINYGKNIIYNHFDQNRFFTGLSYQINQLSQILGGYMYLYQQLATGNQFRNQHTIWVTYTQNLDFQGKN